MWAQLIYFLLLKLELPISYRMLAKIKWIKFEGLKMDETLSSEFDYSIFTKYSIAQRFQCLYFEDIFYSFEIQKREFIFSKF